MTTRMLAVIAAMAAVIVALVIALIWTLIRIPSPTTTPSAPPTMPAPTASTPSYNPSAGDAGDDEDHESGPAEVQEAAWGPVADSFATNFTNTTGGVKKWRQRLIGDPAKPDVTTEVAAQLETVDIRNVPDGHYESRETVKSSDYDLAVKVDYREGWAMVLYLITDGTNWQIYAYDKWEQ